MFKFLSSYKNLILTYSHLQRYYFQIRSIHRLQGKDLNVYFWSTQFPTGDILKLIRWWYNIDPVIFLCPTGICLTCSEYCFVSQSLLVSVLEASWFRMMFGAGHATMVPLWTWFFPLGGLTVCHAGMVFYWAYYFLQLNKVTPACPWSLLKYSSRCVGQP